jgi:hypothetical protein
MDLDYTAEKLDAAVRTLKEGTSEPRYRLANAFISQLMQLSEADFPNDVKKDFRHIVHELTKTAPQADESSIQAWAAGLSPEAVDDLITRICNLQERVQAIHHKK